MPALAALAFAFTTAVHAAAPAFGFDGGVRTQDDLFGAVNGRWLARTPIPPDKAEYGTFIEIIDRTEHQLRDLVGELTRPGARPSGAEAQIADYYASYVDTARIDRLGLAPVRPLLAEIDAIATPRELALWLGRMQRRIEMPVQLDVDADPKQPALNRAATWQGGLGLPDRDYYLQSADRGFAQAREAYRRYLATLARLAGEHAPAAAAARVLALEHRIAEAHWDKVDNRDPLKTYNPMTPAELAARAPGFDWAAFLEGAGLGSIDRLSVSQPSQASGSAKLFAEVPLAEWKLYLRLHALDEAAPVLPAPFRAAHFAFHGRALTGATRPPPRWQSAIRALDGALGEALGRAYVQRHFPPAAKARIEEMVANLLAASRESIDALTWMAPETKEKARAKLAKYDAKVGYPERWRDYGALVVTHGDALGNRQRAAAFDWQRVAARAGRPVDRAQWDATPQTVNAYYSALRNEIVFPAAILQPPLFDMAADDAVNYGATGSTIGHEISHGFDDEGSQFDGDGRLERWWTDADRQAFEATAARLVAQFDAYEPIPGRHVNGKLTLGENIADLAGLEIAYKAYLRSLKGRPPPVIGGLTGAQRFFLGYALSWREKVRPERALQLLTSDPHAPAAERCNGSAINSDAFHEAFGTKPGDRMWKAPAERIRIW